MQIEIDIRFDQLVQLAKKLPSKQWAKIKDEVEKENSAEQISDPESFLLSAPAFTENQLSEFDKTRKEISQWK